MYGFQKINYGYKPVILLTTYVMVLLLKFPSGKRKIMYGSTGIIKAHPRSSFLILTIKSLFFFHLMKDAILKVLLTCLCFLLAKFAIAKR